MAYLIVITEHIQHNDTVTINSGSSSLFHTVQTINLSIKKFLSKYAQIHKKQIFFAFTVQFFNRKTSFFVQCFFDLLNNQLSFLNPQRGYP